MSASIVSLIIGRERDVVLVRQRARQIAAALGFDGQDQTRIATALSEIARNAFRYAGGGRVEFRLDGVTPPQLLTMRVSDQGPGIADLSSILEGRYRSSTGMGIGLVGARRLMDQFDIRSSPEIGTVVTLKKLLPARAGLVGCAELARLADQIRDREPEDAIEEVQRQNQELLTALGELGRRQDELEALNRELEDTNRGVVALYAELDERADHLRRADELKTRFLSNMSHEFRTPVNSIQALAQMLLERTDGELAPEQERQVHYIGKAANALAELVDDLLDLAKAEAGKITIRPTEFEVSGLFGALRGMLRPLLVNPSVALVFDEPEGVPPLHTDESRVSQILRNFVSNALKFTERGEVRISARIEPDHRHVAFCVSDTGIGIAPVDQEFIFQEFTQVDGPIQRKVRGTGLGLPLCRRLAELLGGEIDLQSTPGKGSNFTAVLPIWYEAPTVRTEWEIDPGRTLVLVVEDEPESLLLYKKFVAASAFQVVGAASLREARELMAHARPSAIVLDVLLKGEDGWGFLAELKRQPGTASIPVILITHVDDAHKGYALGADAYCLKPVGRAKLLEVLTQVTAPETVRRILIVDDEEISRYVVRQQLARPGHVISEAQSGAEGLERARSERPDLICLDLMMPDLSGFEVLAALRQDPITRDTPVIVVTSQALTTEQRHRLKEFSTVLLPKSALSQERALTAMADAVRLVGNGV